MSGVQSRVMSAPERTRVRSTIRSGMAWISTSPLTVTLWSRGSDTKCISAGYTPAWNPDISAVTSTESGVVPAALSGIAAAFIVSISRAIGETMIVAIAAGAGPNFTLNPFDAAETMTGHIVRISGGDLSYDSIDYNSIFAIGLLLFIMTLGLNIISQRIVRRFREEYE